MKFNLDTLFGAMNDLEAAANALDRGFSKPKSLMRVCSAIIKNGKLLQRHPDRSLKRLAKSVTDGAGELQAIIKGFKGKYDDWFDLEEYESLVEWLIEEIYSLNTEIDQIAQEMDESKPMKTYSQFIAEARRKSKKDYVIYHNSYSDAVAEAIALAQRQGYEVDEDDYFNKVSTGPRKPSEGKTNSIKLLLTKNGKPVRNMLVFQVYGMKRQYELTAYVS